MNRFLLFLIILFSSLCHSCKQASQLSFNAEASSEEIEKRLTDAWNNIGKIPLDKEYCSPAYNQALKDALVLAEKIDDYTPFSEFNHWVQDMDYSYVKMEIKKIEVQDSHSAKALVMIDNSGNSVSSVELLLVNIDDKWYIDDWITNNNSERQELADYLKENNQ